ncbi:predicted protein [Histoplasma mississippiense (nom. inval.)]|uniref:predicted protein n=1 Tax=Ajellomyces capsulatus (strain NAm1 / WU24) TaxID=2059318 RepID=UPI000157CE60|nr:predicted protein [Histoplasma mississippiense (nom. inval.)]EDN10454.1 predicted protein [Histoplasma mississippiense (nom. inval.)]
MREKRKIPPRGGESAAKRKLSEAALKRDTTPAKRKASATPTIASLPEPEKRVLPTKIEDGSPLPTLTKPQPSTLSPEEFQSYAESAVLSAALQRSRIRWLNDCIFEKYWTKPSKKKSQPQPRQNPPRESMSKLGPCNIIIEPHHFEAMLFTVRNPLAQQPIQYAPPQRPIVQYTPPNNFYRYQPQPQPPGQPRQPYSPGLHTSPIATAPPPQQLPSQSRLEQSHNNAPPPSTQSIRQSRPEGPNPPSQNRIRQNYPAKSEPMQNTPAKNPPEQSQPVKTSPDPVIHMLATRAASNPELKALMRIVASSKANQAQLRAFQAHIDELNAILASRRQNESQSVAAHLKPDQQGRPFTPGPPQPPSSSSARTPLAPAQPTPSHYFHSNDPSISNQTGPAHASPSTHSSYQNQPPSQSIGPKTSQQPPPHNTYFHQHTPSQPPVPPKPDPKAIVFEFLSPSPAGNNSTHTASGDRYLFPANTILDYFPGGTTVIASFLIIKKIDPSTPPPDLSANNFGKSRAKKSKLASAIRTTPPPDTSLQSLVPAPKQGTTDPATQHSPSEKPTSVTTTGPEIQAPTTTTATTTTTEGIPPPSKPKTKEYYQPVTIRLHASNPRTLEPLARVVNPPAEVRKYMNDIMDRMERADIEYLAFRLPHEGVPQTGAAAAATAGGDELLQTVGEQKPQQQQARSARRKSKGRGEKTVDSEAENGVAVKQEGGGGDDDDEGNVEDVQFEEELKEFYDMPNGIVPLR